MREIDYDGIFCSIGDRLNFEIGDIRIKEDINKVFNSYKKK